MSRRRVARRAAAAIACALLVAGCTDAPTAPSPAPTAPPRPPTASIDVSSVPVPTVADLAIPVGLDDETLPSAVVDAVNRWLVAGIGPETVQLADAAEVNVDAEEYADGELWVGELALLIARAQTPAHAEALFGPDWLTVISPTTVSIVEVMNAANLTTELVGYESPAHGESSYWLTELQGVTANVDGSTTFAVQVRRSGGRYTTWTFTTAELDGRMILLEPFDLLP